MHPVTAAEVPEATVAAVAPGEAAVAEDADNRNLIKENIYIKKLSGNYSRTAFLCMIPFAILLDRPVGSTHIPKTRIFAIFFYK